jgi:hypothetical protein
MNSATTGTFTAASIAQSETMAQWEVPQTTQFDITLGAFSRSNKLDVQQKAYLIKELADWLTEDAAGLDAARKSAEAAGDIEWRGYCWSGYLNQIYKHALIGAQALIDGERGNAYSRYLENRFPELK